MGEPESEAKVVLQPTQVSEKVYSLENISTNPTIATDSVAEKQKGKRGRKKKSDTILSARKDFEFIWKLTTIS